MFKGDRGEGDEAATDGHKDGERREKESEIGRESQGSGQTDRLTRADRQTAADT